MAARSKTIKIRREPQPTGDAVIGETGHGINGHAVNGRAVPLRSLTEQALDTYFASLNGHAPGQLYDLVLREVEEPLFRAVLDYSAGNQSRAADILGINRGTLRKKLRVYGIAG
jgi:Fis family transcriptional regulator